MEYHICIISHRYPSKEHQVALFVHQLVAQFARRGIRCSVIAPQSLLSALRHKMFNKRYRVVDIEGGVPIEIYQPFILSFPSRFRFCRLLNEKLASKGIERICKIKSLVPNVFYAHFWSSGYRIFRHAQKNGTPLYIASGESKIGIQNDYSDDFVRACSEYLTKVICVSSKNKRESLALGLCKDDSCVVIPNGINLSLFQKLDRNTLRGKYKITHDDFVVVFVGSFIERKGVLRLCAALEKIDDKRIKAIFIGRGPQQPEYARTIYKGVVPHHILPEYLSLADVFVLPTLHEGCSNAIIEAMGCGLPIVSSNRPFNDDILTDENSIRVDPLNVDELAASISRLAEDEDLRKSMSVASLNMTMELDLEKRAEKILALFNGSEAKSL